MNSIQKRTQADKLMDTDIRKGPKKKHGLNIT